MVNLLQVIVGNFLVTVNEQQYSQCGRSLEASEQQNKNDEQIFKR
jgi:hypothetical protein